MTSIISLSLTISVLYGVQRFRKIAAFIFLAGFLVGSTSLREFYKLPALLSHFQHHQQQHQSESLLLFLAAHYMHENGTDEDAADDSELPFKSMEALIGTATAAIIPQAFATGEAAKPVESDQIFLLFNDRAPDNLYTCRIWQPPRHS